ncbi:hypothetical protein Lsan_3139 [Legionella santicrucis]|uniref:Uncharacterized protein n=1 Tax=Legionella santicrucis TaxID=45074 RepID=A0A0W0YGE7_9GAMM|nr:hypothetical protein [Legionella santicrucis]KTD55587.1 hypothetical protein Lsan_3139 [Legionella santicrucis]
MGIFKEIAIRYCEKIYDAYKLQADEKTYKGKEAELLIERNEFARCLIKTIRSKELNEDYNQYFQQLLNEISTALEHVNTTVIDYNSKHSTAFTSDLYDSFFTSSLKNFINALSDLYQKSPEIIKSIQDNSSFNNNRSVPWIYQFSFVLYEYILEKEFELATNKNGRDIFDTKIQLIQKYVQNAASLYSRFENNEEDSEYKELTKMLLQKMQTDENDIQRRKSQQSTNSVYSYFSQTFYKASETIMGKSQLGEKIDFLIKEFNERSMVNTLQYY